eukprot:2132529-Pyramimonas_sp.AAC.1
MLQAVQHLDRLGIQSQLVAVVEHRPLAARQHERAFPRLVVLAPRDGAHDGLVSGDLACLPAP